LKSERFESPQLFVTKAEELPLSGSALLELMRAVLARGTSFRFCARGWSMAPFIRDGDVITVCPFRRARPGVGQVVAFTRPGEGNVVVHRVVARRGQNSYIQGDGVPGHADGIIPADNLLGRVTRVERDGHDVWLGLGPERYAIAWLSRTRRLIPLGAWLASWLKPLLRRLG
jgi:hypothetical protein